MSRRILIGLVLFMMAMPVIAWAANPAINSTDTKVIASDFFSDGSNWPYWGPEGNGTYYYPTGFIAEDPRSGQDALFLFVQGGQTDSANLFIDQPTSSYVGCGSDEAIQLIIPAADLGTRTDLIGTVFKPDNTIRVSQCNDYWGASTHFWNHRNGDRFVLLNSNDGHIELIESPSSLGTDQYRSWINRRELIVDVASGADTPIHFDLSESPTTEAFSPWPTLKYRDWEGILRFQDDNSNPGGLQVGRVKVRYSPYLYGSTDPWRVFIVDDGGSWHMVDPSTQIVDFDFRIYKGGMVTGDMFSNEFSWFEAWLQDYSQGRGDIPPGCSVTADADGDGRLDYRKGWTGETLAYYRWWANAATSSGGFGSTKVTLQDGSTPWNPYRPGHLHYSTGREGVMRVNYGGKRYLLSAHNDTNICDPTVDSANSYQGLYVTIEELTYYDAY